MLKYQSFYKSFLIFCFIFFITGCHKAPETPVRIATNDWPGYRPFYLASNLGFLSEDEAHLIELTSASEVMRNFKNGVVDAAALTMDEALLLVQEGYDVRIVLVMDISHGGDAILAKKSITNFSELKGKRVGVEKTALGAYLLSRAMEINGIDVGDIYPVTLESSEHESAFLNGKVDAVVTFDPVRSRLLAHGANTLFDSKAIPNEIVDVLVVRNEYLKNNSNRINDLISGWFKALAYIKKESNKSYEILAPITGLSVDKYREASSGIRFPGLNENLQLLTDHDKGLYNIAFKLKSIMLDQKLLEKDFSLENILYSKSILEFDK